MNLADWDWGEGWLDCGCFRTRAVRPYFITIQLLDDPADADKALLRYWNKRGDVTTRHLGELQARVLAAMTPEEALKHLLGRAEDEAG